MGRLFWVAFLGAPKSDAAEHAKESPLVMTVPLLVLAVLSVVGGMTWLWPDTLGELIRADLDHLHHMEGYKAAQKRFALRLSSMGGWSVCFLLLLWSGCS